jgi:branched-chain amino acid transport system substrate-binding protein
MAKRAGRSWLVFTAVLAFVLGVAAVGAHTVPPRQVTAGPAGTGGAGGAGAGALAAPTAAGDTLTGPAAESGPASPAAAGEPAEPAAAPGGTTAGSAAPRAGAVYDPGVTDTSILIGGSTFTSGPAAVYGDQIAVGFAAGVNYINEHGGINGRRVILKVYDDGGDPTRQLENVKRLVEVDHAFSLAMVYSPIVGQYVDSTHIPVFQEGQFDTDFTDPWWFSMGGPQTLAAMTLAHFGVRSLGVKSAAIFYLDAGANNYSKGFADQVARDWEAYGVKVPVEEAFTPDQTSCSDALSAASAAKVDFIDFEIDASKVINCAIQGQVQDYRPPKGWGGYLIGVPVIWQALGDESVGMYAMDAFGALYNVPAYQAAVHQVSGQTDADSSVTAANFYAALLMGDAIAKLGNDITRARLQAVLNTFTDWQPGLTADPDQPSWTWTPACHAALKGGYIIQIQKHPDGSLAWDQITPEATSTPLPPGIPAPPQWSGCHIFSPG